MHYPLRHGAGLVGVCLPLMLAACASQPLPNEQLAVGKSAVDAAQTAGAAEYAPLELDAAREKIARASTAQRAKHYEEARRLAAEAEVDAELARAKAGSQKTQQAVDELNASIRVLRDEINRNSQATPQ
ncbi:DUF4398 domain-containing protein [Chitinimonas arctica]|uniref:DUF4398 domain-containing protein n=2 Tax=Chitinimonas arctica TaxID=2594795 RepID=A0A516SHE9_9NEIS|nr:DUF4398 domain-containing protein [Chitinimonas arctica]